ncbi:MAG: 2-isopropylmalate synthase [Planctomycetes bacterium]|nr:2-isopropylmalate synthase [Planctomycetota bacterium]
MQNGRSHLIHDWNQTPGLPAGRVRPLVNDESLRDGLQSPSVRHPTADEMVEVLLAVEAVGIDAMNIGLPGAGPHVVATAKRLATEIRDRKLRVKPNCAARTVVQDIEPIRRIIEDTGVEIEVAMFIGSSPIRLEVEGWDVDRLLSTSEVALKYCADHRLPIMYVTEDTTRADPDAVRRLYGLALDMGAQRLVVCDTCGHATPDGVRKLVRFVRQVAVDHGKPDVQIDWHGHNDRGLAMVNTLAAYEGGADRLHATALGIGERAGNCAMDQLLVNLRLLGWWGDDRPLTGLKDYVQKVSTHCRVGVPFNYPVVGKDAFETGTGVHAAAVIKALKRGDRWLANRVYSGVPADDFGYEQRISVGPMSGKSNVVWWLERHGYAADDERVNRIFSAAKAAERVLTDAELADLATAKA